MNQIDDLLILGFSFTTQQLSDLREAINVALSTFENSSIDPNMVLQDRFIAIRKPIEYMIEKKQSYKH
jgi:hypothetical protein